MRSLANLRLGRLNTALGVWASLVALGLAPTAVAVIAAVTGSATWLWIALAASLAANAALILRIVRMRRRAEEFKAAIRSAVVEYPGELRQTSTQWVPTPLDLLSLSIGLSDLEKTWSEAESKANHDVGPDVKLGLSKVSLGSVPTVEVDGWSDDAGVRFTVGCRFDGGCWLSAWKDKELPPWMGRVGDQPLWRTDDTWRELVRRSWLRERPFRGEVHLVPDWPATGEGPASWRIDYIRMEEKVNHPRRSYRLIDGELVDGADTW
jgi:hypothetical protein